MIKIFLNRIVLLLILIYSKTVLANDIDLFQGDDKQKTVYTEMMKVFEKGTAFPSKILLKDTIITIPLTLHIVRDKKGDCEPYEPLFSNSLKRVNRFFRKAGIRFFLAGDVQFHDNSSWYQYYEPEIHESELTMHNISNTINVWIVSSSTASSAYAQYPEPEYPDIVVIQNRLLLHPVFEFELGYSLGLFHNHSRLSKESSVLSREPALGGVTHPAYFEIFPDPDQWGSDVENSGELLSEYCTPGTSEKKGVANLQNDSLELFRSELTREQAVFIRWNLFNNPDRRKLILHNFASGTQGIETEDRLPAHLSFLSPEKVDSIHWKSESIVIGNSRGSYSTITHGKANDMSILCRYSHNSKSECAAQKIVPDDAEPFGDGSIVVDLTGDLLEIDGNHTKNDSSEITVGEADYPYYVRFGVDLSAALSAELSFRTYCSSGDGCNRQTVRVDIDSEPFFFTPKGEDEIFSVNLTEFLGDKMAVSFSILNENKGHVEIDDIKIKTETIHSGENNRSSTGMITVSKLPSGCIAIRQSLEKENLRETVTVEGKVLRPDKFPLSSLKGAENDVFLLKIREHENPAFTPETIVEM